MSNINELTAKLKAAAREVKENSGRARYTKAMVARQEFKEIATFENVLALTDALEAAEKRIAELEAREETLRPVGVMSEKAFHRLEGSESRFIALWPRPGIYLPRKRPDDGVLVYARTGLAGITLQIEGE